MIIGAEREEYGLLWNYCQGYTTKFQEAHVSSYRSDRKNDIFHRIYIYFASLKVGFLQCRYITGLDGCHLSSTSKGVLLTVVGIDPNNQIYLFAYAVNEKENSNVWNWFISLLVRDLNISVSSSDQRTFVTDK
ncbi:unnamed protein product [Musa textilis]